MLSSAATGFEMDPPKESYKKPKRVIVNSELIETGQIYNP
jgi:hypothetical protein